MAQEKRRRASEVFRSGNGFETDIIAISKPATAAVT